jgi:hypothetical protein
MRALDLGIHFTRQTVEELANKQRAAGARQLKSISSDFVDGGRHDPKMPLQPAKSRSASRRMLPLLPVPAGRIA